MYICKIIDAAEENWNWKENNHATLIFLEVLTEIYIYFTSSLRELVESLVLTTWYVFKQPFPPLFFFKPRLKTTLRFLEKLSVKSQHTPLLYLFILSFSRDIHRVSVRGVEKWKNRGEGDRKEGRSKGVGGSFPPPRSLTKLSVASVAKFLTSVPERERERERTFLAAASNVSRKRQSKRRGAAYPGEKLGRERERESKRLENVHPEVRRKFLVSKRPTSGFSPSISRETRDLSRFR